MKFMLLIKQTELFWQILWGDIKQIWVSKKKEV